MQTIGQALINFKIRVAQKKNSTQIARDSQLIFIQYKLYKTLQSATSTMFENNETLFK